MTEQNPEPMKPEGAPSNTDDGAWFREPTRREHRIAAALFIGFGLFFVMLWVVQQGWWFRWVVLGLGVYSILHGLRHARDARLSRV
jgi:hypothetical protein